MDRIRKQILESVDVKRSLLENNDILQSISEAAELCISALRNGKKIMFAGNGGSAADAQHLAAELVNRFEFDRPALAAIAITTDTSVLTSVSNDYSFERVFARQIEAIGSEGDILIALSTSGNSVSIIEGLKTARAKNIPIIGLTGNSGGKMTSLCDISIKVPSERTTRIQESHILIGHILCSEIESAIFGKQ